MYRLSINPSTMKRLLPFDPTLLGHAIAFSCWHSVDKILVDESKGIATTGKIRKDSITAILMGRTIQRIPEQSDEMSKIFQSS